MVLLVVWALAAVSLALIISAPATAAGYGYDAPPTESHVATTPTANLSSATTVGRPPPSAPRGSTHAASAPLLATEEPGITAADGTEITGYTRHGLNRAIGDGPQAPGVAERAGTDPGAILDALRNPQKITEGVDQFGRPYKVYSGSDARVVVNPQTGRIISTNPLGGAGVRGGS